MLNFIRKFFKKSSIEKEYSGTGAVPDKGDYRDFEYIPSMGAGPVDWETGYDVEKDINIKIPIKDQNGSSSCVSQAWSYYVAVLDAVENKVYTEVSAKAIFSQIFLSYGAYIRDGAKLIVNWGSLPENLVSSYDNGKPPRDPFIKDNKWKNSEMDKKANILKAKEYRMLLGKYSMDDFARAIKNNKGVVTGLFVGNNKSWRTLDPTPSVRTLGHCFTAGNKVLTNYGHKNIEDIKIGDLVLTHKNRFKEVLAIDKREYNGFIHKLSTVGSIEETIVTPEHPFYCLRAKKHGIKFLIENKIKDKDSIHKYLFKPISEIATEMREKSPSRLKRNKQKNIYDNVLIEGIWPYSSNKSLNKNEAFLLGAYLGDGNLAWSKQKNGNIHYYKIRFSFGLNKRKGLLRKKVITAMEEEFNLKPHVYNVKNQKCEQLIFYSKDVADFFKEYCGTPRNKKIKHDILSLPNDILLSFLDGWYMTDGCKSKNKMIISTSEINLAYGLSTILNKLNFSYSVQKRLGGKGMFQDKIINVKDSWHFSYRDGDNNGSASWFTDNKKLLKIKKLKKEKFNGYVYNLEVKDDNSYTINNLIVHNCIYLGKFGIDKKGRYISTPNSWGTKKGTDSLHPDGWQKLRKEYFNSNFIFNPWTLTDKPNDDIKDKACKIMKKNEKKIIIEGEGYGRKGIIIDGKLREILDHTNNRATAACLYVLANNGFGETVPTDVFNAMEKKQNF